MAVVNGIDYGEIVTELGTFQLGPDGIVADEKTKERLGWGSAMVCIACEQPMAIPGGFCGTDLCGPCCTGEAVTLEEFGVSW